MDGTKCKLPVNTFTVCFLCFEDINETFSDLLSEVSNCADADSRMISLRSLLHYLDIDLTNSFSKESLVKALKRKEVEVRVCKECKVEVSSFSKLYYSMELLRMKLDSRLEMIQNKLKNLNEKGDNFLEEQKRKMHANLEEREISEDLRVALELRDALAKKCKINKANSLPRVFVESLNPLEIPIQKNNNLEEEPAIHRSDSSSAMPILDDLPNEDCYDTSAATPMGSDCNAAIPKLIESCILENCTVKDEETIEYFVDDDNYFDGSIAGVDTKDEKQVDSSFPSTPQKPIVEVETEPQPLPPPTPTVKQPPPPPVYIDPKPVYKVVKKKKPPQLERKYNFRPLDSSKKKGKQNLNRLWKCPTCQKGCISKSLLENHVRTHSEDRPFQCNTCGLSFKHQKNLEAHEDLHRPVEERRFKCRTPQACSICQKVLASTRSMKVHMRIHTGEAPFKCKICKKRFKQKNVLIYHRRAQHPTPEELKEKEERRAKQKEKERTFFCDICPKSFKEKRHLLNHLDLHNPPEERKYKHNMNVVCEICSKVLATQKQLKRHMKMHAEDKPFQCEFCPLRFIENSDLAKHARTHARANGTLTEEEILKYQCKVCDKILSSQRCLATHLKLHNRTESD